MFDQLASPIGAGSIATMLLPLFARWVISFLRLDIRRNDQQLIEIFNKEIQVIAQRNVTSDFDKLFVEQAVHARFGSPVPYPIVKLAFSSHNASRFVQLLAQSSSFFTFTKDGSIYLNKTKSLDSERAWAIGAYFFFSLLGCSSIILVYELKNFMPALWIAANLFGLLGVVLAFLALKIDYRVIAGKAFVDEYPNFINDLPQKSKMSLAKKISFPFTAKLLSGSTKQISR